MNYGRLELTDDHGGRYLATQSRKIGLRIMRRGDACGGVVGYYASPVNPSLLMNMKDTYHYSSVNAGQRRALILVLEVWTGVDNLESQELSAYHFVD